MNPLEVSRCLTSRVAGVDENTAGLVLISRKGAGSDSRSLASSFKVLPWVVFSPGRGDRC